MLLIMLVVYGMGMIQASMGDLELQSCLTRKRRGVWHDFDLAIHARHEKYTA